MKLRRSQSFILFALVPTLTLLVSAFYFFEVVTNEVQQQLTKSAQLVSREIRASAEQLSLFSEMAPDFLRSAGDKEVQLKLNRLIYGSRGVISSELLVPSEGLSLRNNFSTDGLYLNVPPQTPCRVEARQDRSAVITKFGQVNYQFCDGGHSEITRALEHDDVILGTVSVVISLPELVSKVTSEYPAPSLALNPATALDFECRVNDPGHWCSVGSSPTLLKAAAKSNLGMFAKAAFLLFLIILLITQIVLIPINNAWIALQDIAHGNAVDVTNQFGRSFLFRKIEKSISNLSRIAAENIKLREESAGEKGRINISKQIAHDIRSPLAALEMAMSKANGLPEDSRLIIRNSVNRIRDIANSLLFKQKDPLAQSAPAFTGVSSDEAFTTTLLAPLIETIVTEKRLEYRERLHLSIDFNQGRESYGVFVRLQLNEFKRALSNIVNNSVESIGAGIQGRVRVQLSSQDGIVSMEVIDNGCGIPAEVLGTLGNQGVTYRKPGGTGLGLYHAFETVRRVGGRFRIDSDGTSGTRVEIQLKAEPQQSWFVSEIRVKPGQKVIVFDDDLSIHQIWSERFESFNRISGCGVALFHAGNPAEFRRIFGENFFDDGDALFLMDYEILGTRETGLSLILEMGIQAQSILVTSHYEDAVLRATCEREDVRLVPKSMSGFVPIARETVREAMI
jgi:signal transduction histidine kinase